MMVLKFNVNTPYYSLPLPHLNWKRYTYRAALVLLAWFHMDPEFQCTMRACDCCPE